MRKDPAAFLKDLKKSGQPKNGLTISILLDTCGSLEHWPSLRDAGIIEMVQNVAISAEAREVVRNDFYSENKRISGCTHYFTCRYTAWMPTRNAWSSFGKLKTSQ